MKDDQEVPNFRGNSKLPDMADGLTKIENRWTYIAYQNRQITSSFSEPNKGVGIVQWVQSGAGVFAWPRVQKQDGFGGGSKKKEFTRVMLPTLLDRMITDTIMYVQWNYTAHFESAQLLADLETLQTIARYRSFPLREAQWSRQLTTERRNGFEPLCACVSQIILEIRYSIDLR